MLIIPELQKVVIQPPRTGSTSLRQAVFETYPLAMCLYRHMEWAGVPAGYEHFTPVYVYRRPIDRLASLYRFMGTRDPDDEPTSNVDYREWAIRQKADVQRPFEEWLRDSTELFNVGGTHASNSYMTTYHKVPAVRKSFWHWMSAKDGTYPELMEAVYFADAQKALGCETDYKLNGTSKVPRVCRYSDTAKRLVDAHHAVDQMIHDKEPVPAYNHDRLTTRVNVRYLS